MDQEAIWKYTDDGDIQGYTLVVPSVAVGNVGQLACDLLISSLDMKKITSLYHPALIPVAGCDPYDLNSASLSTCCEIYKCVSKSLLVVQLRAPLVFKYARAFLQELVSKFKEKQVKDIIILTSSYAHEKRHILTSPFRYVATELCSFKTTIQNHNWTEHESLSGGVHILGGGFASLLYDICKEKQVSCLVLYKYCSEGDNIPDAVDMIAKLVELVPLFSNKDDLLSQLIQPVSWKLLFGRPPPQDIY